MSIFFKNLCYEPTDEIIMDIWYYARGFTLLENAIIKSLWSKIILLGCIKVRDGITHCVLKRSILVVYSFVKYALCKFMHLTNFPYYKDAYFAKFRSWYLLYDRIPNILLKFLSRLCSFIKTGTILAPNISKYEQYPVLVTYELDCMVFVVYM